jgi:hypothetical protein
MQMQMKMRVSELDGSSDILWLWSGSSGCCHSLPACQAAILT